MNIKHNISRDFVYIPYDHKLRDIKTNEEKEDDQNISNDLHNEILKTIAREIIKERTPTLEEVESTLHELIRRKQLENNIPDVDQYNTNRYESNVKKTEEKKQVPVITRLIKKGYLKDSKKWLSSKGFTIIGGKILQDVLNELKNGDIGLHETKNLGNGTIILDTTKRYEIGDDIRLVDVPKSLLNSIQRLAKDNNRIKIPLELKIEDFEEYETMRDVRVAVVYCIDLSSTMRYSTLYGNLSRIEAAKKALWTLYLLNRKYFPSDIIDIIGFGALASKIKPLDIPYLKTFEPGTDFLHYTNYQAALRLAKKILDKKPVENKRIVLITDGHPSACFIDSESEQEKILSLRPYSHFYVPDKDLINSIKQTHDMSLDVNAKELVYLCYRYRQVDQFIGERTIMEARRCKKLGIQIDTIMISEEDSLLNYVNEMEKYVNGRSYYINPDSIDKILLTDYISNKKMILRSGRN